MKYRKENLQKSDFIIKKFTHAYRHAAHLQTKQQKTLHIKERIISELCGGVDDDNDGEHIQLYVLDFPYCALAPFARVTMI